MSSSTARPRTCATRAARSSAARIPLPADLNGCEAASAPGAGWSPGRRTRPSSLRPPRVTRSIAEELFLSERAVERHISSIFGKLDLPTTDQDHRRVLAVLAYL